MQRTLFAIALCAVMATGCGGSGRFVQKGIDRYDRADYPGAMDEFAGLSDSERSFNQKGLVRYLVYRGLTQYHLGQRPAALTYLNRGKEAYVRGTSSWLSPTIAAEMEKAIADLNGQPVPAGSSPPATPSPPDTATAATPPPPTTGEALVATKPPPAKTATAAATPAPVKTATPAPVKTTSVPTKTSSSSQSTSPK